MKRFVSSSLFLLTLLAGAAAIDCGEKVMPDLFVTADSCVACHNGLITTSGEDASFGVDWRASMMANAARDPYWQAAIRRETLVHPEAAAAIENECGACHMPISRYQANAAGGKGRVFAHLPISHGSTPAALMAADGVSCSVCHQIQDEKLGEKESFNAGFVVDEITPRGEREIFGPYEVDAGRKAVMQSASLFLPAKAAHVQSSELCATCHTLHTHALGPGGQSAGELPEQVPYLEWRHSAYYGTRSCQSCHMPEVEGKMPISGVMGIPRENVSRHAFRGGNFFMPKILNRYRDELGVRALPSELEATSRRAVEHLQGAAAGVSVERVELSEGTLRATVTIENRAGHKLPSAYPSRRAWIHFTVRDPGGRLLFESGRFNPDGSIQGNDNDADPDRFEPHHEAIDSVEQVQIYEPIMADSDGVVTTVLLSGVRYIKDNRLLPDGFDKATAEEDIAVRGQASRDENFGGGRDRVRYAVDVTGARGPFRVSAELWYQPIAYRWARNLGDQEAEEIERFTRYYGEMAAESAIILARAEVETP